MTTTTARLARRPSALDASADDDDGRRDGRRKRIRNAEFLPTARRRVDGRVDGRRASSGVVVVVGVVGARPRW